MLWKLHSYKGLCKREWQKAHSCIWSCVITHLWAKLPNYCIHLLCKPIRQEYGCAQEPLKSCKRNFIIAGQINMFQCIVKTKVPLGKKLFLEVHKISKAVPGKCMHFLPPFFLSTALCLKQSSISSISQTFFFFNRNIFSAIGNPRWKFYLHCVVCWREH